MIIAHTSDWHLGKRERNDPIRYMDNFIAVNRLIDQLIEEEITLLVHAGDMFDDDSPTPQTLNLTYHLLTKLKSNGIKLVMVRGNHDASQRKLEHNIVDFFNNIEMVTVLENEVKNIDGITFYGIGYTNNYNQALKELYQKKPISTDAINVLILHASVYGFPVSDKRENYMAKEFAEFAIDDLEYDFNYIALGHHHCTDIKQNDKTTIAYSGATEHWNVDNWEEGWSTHKNWLKVSLAQGEAASVEVKPIEVRAKHKLRKSYLKPEDDPEEVINYIRDELDKVIESDYEEPIFNHQYNLHFKLIDHDATDLHYWRDTFKGRNVLPKPSTLRLNEGKTEEELKVIEKQSDTEVINSYLQHEYGDNFEFWNQLVKKSLASMDKNEEIIQERMMALIEELEEAP
ncbi:MAG: DNA repair exonuclease [Candidatus Heimdallarchaeota archaeon]|nr:DNA repair exonuclease [Candidatus Heimdallarchaeota archaeon]